MAATTQDAIYRGILSDLKDGLDASVIADNFIYITPIEMFSQENERAIQLIPGTPVAVDPRSGTGLIREEFQVCYWQRLHLDQARRFDEKITNDTLGILTMIAAVRAELIQGTADGTATVPIEFLRGSRFTENELHAGWVQMTDTYRIGYEIAWEV